MAEQRCSQCHKVIQKDIPFQVKGLVCRECYGDDHYDRQTRSSDTTEPIEAALDDICIETSDTSFIASTSP